MTPQDKKILHQFLDATEGPLMDLVEIFKAHKNKDILFALHVVINGGGGSMISNVPPEQLNEFNQHCTKAARQTLERRN